MRKTEAPKSASMRTKAPWKPGERVCSLEELYRAADIRLSRKVPISKYFRDLEETLEKAKTRLMDQDLQYAYVFYLRYVTVVVKHLPNLPDYNRPEHAKDRERTSRNAKKALTTLERLQPILQQRHDEYVKYLESVPRPKASVTTYSTRHGMSGRRMSNTSEPVLGHKPSDAGPNGATATDHPGQPADKEFSLAETFQGLNFGNSTTTHSPSAAAPSSAQRESAPIVYPSLPTTITTKTDVVADPRSTASVDRIPQEIYSSQPPALPPRPNSASISPGGNPPPCTMTMPSPQHVTTNYCTIPITSPSVPILQSPPSGNGYTAAYPAVPPKPQEYHGGTPGEATSAAVDSFMPPCFIGSTHYSLTEGGVRMRPVQVPEGIFDEFIDIAQANTQRNLEMCGILCGKQIPGQEALVMTTLIIPKQRSTSDTCVTEHEEELFAEQMDRDLITLGWIHTHPTQTCFMSSLDLHTQCSYQLMLPEAIAIVCAPRSQPRFGIFRLTDPSGMDTIQSCKEQSAFHPHDESKIIYTNANDGGHVVMANYDFDIVDIRGV